MRSLCLIFTKKIRNTLKERLKKLYILYYNYDRIKSDHQAKLLKSINVDDFILIKKKNTLNAEKSIKNYNTIFRIICNYFLLVSII